MKCQYCCYDSDFQVALRYCSGLEKGKTVVFYGIGEAALYPNQGPFNFQQFWDCLAVFIKGFLAPMAPILKLDLGATVH